MGRKLREVMKVTLCEEGWDARMRYATDYNLAELGNATFRDNTVLTEDEGDLLKMA